MERTFGLRPRRTFGHNRRLANLGTTPMRAKHLLHSTLLSGALALSATASAADFRVLDFDAPCEQIESLEQARGSTTYDGKLPSGYHFAFRVREMDRDALAVYACDAGKFFRGGYIFEPKDEADATALYTAVKKRVTRELGTPSYDFASKQHRKKMSDIGATLSRADTQVAFWNAKNSEAHASVAAPSKDRGWRVSLSYTANSHLDEGSLATGT